MTEKRQDWFFSFSVNHVHANGYVKIHGTFIEAREEMFKRHGKGWCWQYESADAVGVERFHLHEVTEPIQQ